MVLQFECGTKLKKKIDESTERVIVCDVYGTLLLITSHGYNLALMEFLVDARERGYDVLIATERVSIAAAKKDFERVMMQNPNNRTVQDFCQHIKICAKEDMPVESAVLGFDNVNMRYMRFDTAVIIDRYGFSTPTLDVLRARYQIYSQPTVKELSVGIS